MSSAYETLLEICDRIVSRDHPVLCCLHALTSHTKLQLAKADVYRLAEELVDGAEEFLDSMAAIPAHPKYKKPSVKCMLCGSAVCPSYGFPGMTGQVTLLGVAIAAPGGKL